MTRQWPWRQGAWSVCLLIGMVSLLAACRGTSDGERSAAPVAESSPSPAVIILTADADSASGIQVVRITPQAFSETLQVLGEVKPNANRVFHINSPVAGKVVEDRAQLGDMVRAGQLLAQVRNPEVARVHAEFIHELHQNRIDIQQAKTRWELAQANLAREKKLFEKGISPEMDLITAQSNEKLARSEYEGQKEHERHIRSEAKALLGAYGNQLTPRYLDDSRDIVNVSPIRSPRAGMVTQKNITIGDQISPEQLIYEVADLDEVWLDLTIFPKDLGLVSIGLPVTFQTDSMPSRTYQGRINYLVPAARSENATFVARVYLANPPDTKALKASGRMLSQLKPGMMGQAAVHLKSGNASGFFVADEAVHQRDAQYYVYLKTAEHQYEEHPIEVLQRTESGYRVKSGLKQGDQVVVQGSFVLKAEQNKQLHQEHD